MAPEFGKTVDVQNTLHGWAKLSEQVKRATPLTAMTKIKGRLDDHQLFCLRYCFAELDRLEVVDKAPSSLTLRILVDDLDDAYRIQHYLAIMTALRENIYLEIICGDEIISGRRKLADDYYRILPLFCVGADIGRWTAHYFTMVDPGKIENVQKQLENSFQKKFPLVPTRRITSVEELLVRLYIQNLWNLQQNISGTDEEKMIEREKKEGAVKDALRKELLENLKAEFPQLGLLARLFWSLFLRCLSDSKDLFFQDREGEWHVDMETLRCSRLDAISYAEGILQLVENACIHSHMKRAYISIRLNDVDITTRGVERLADAAQVRADISRRYKQLWRNGSADLGVARPQESVPEYTLDQEAKFCLEISVLNDSADLSGNLQGITRMFAKNRGKDEKGMTLMDVFSYQCERVSDISKHYGLRLLEKTVRLNGGFFSVSSPGVNNNQERYGSFYRNADKYIYRQIPDLKDPYTNFDILLPLYPYWHDTERIEKSSPPDNLFQEATLTQSEIRQSVLRFQSEVLRNAHTRENKSFFISTDYLMEPETITLADWKGMFNRRTNWIKVKEDLIEQIWKELDEKMDAMGDTERVYLLDLMQVWDALSLELLAKAVFLLVAWRKTQNKGALRLAVLLPNGMFISEFIRFFSIFYDKKLSDAKWMGKSQLALCGYQKGNNKLPQVQFLLAGETSGSARITARTFAYYNTDATLDLMPQIRYLTRMEKEVSVPQFPFDLFLSAAAKSQRTESESSWFLRRMRQTLDQDLWRRSHGCRLRGIRVRLHSNIYLSDFYEAELLFHNVGVIYRFAHLIAKELLKTLPQQSNKPLVVVGYELYSSVLTEQITKLLERWGNVYYLIYSTSQKGNRFHFPPQLKTMNTQTREQILQQAEYVIVIPIGTTMSTLYRIMREIEAKWQGSFPYNNYVLILVGEEGSSTLSTQYWTQKDPNHVALQPQRKNDKEILCRYYLAPRAQWWDMASEKALDEKALAEKVLVYVDQTSTRPKDIFVVERSRFRGTSYFLKTREDQAENDRRLELLKGLIHYGHIAEGNNHFQFYLDMEQYFFRAQRTDPEWRRKTVDLWLKELRVKVNPNAFNIIVSPLHKEDSPFAKAVIDQVFEHSLRFLHVDLTAAFREDVRAKFSYIADEYREIRQFDRGKPVNVYFINTAITSGGTLARARNLVTMLMEEAGVEYDRESIFKGCFVLINRSAFDTLNSYVKNPEEHFFAYLHLAVPSFNSQRDRCPTCDLLDQYQTLEYSCAGNRLGQEFRRLQAKHAQRSLIEHQVWLEDAVMSGSGYAGWLRQWLHGYIRKRREKDGKIWAGIFEVSETEYTDLKALYKLLQWGMGKYLADQGISEKDLPACGEGYLNAINRFSLTHLKAIIDMHQGSKDTESVESIVGLEHKHCLEPEYWKKVLINYVCAQKKYIRLVSIHKAFLKMDVSMDRLDGSIPERGEATAKILMELIKHELSQAGTLQLQAEWLISYLKVLSRPHLAQYHHIRQGILTLMLQMTAFATGTSDSLPPELSFVEPFLKDPNGSVKELICSQVLQTLLKRLAGLQSTYFLHGENMERVLDAFSQLQESFLNRKGMSGVGYQRFNPIPTWEQVEWNMVRLVKWTSSCGDDENGCYLIEKSFLEKGKE